jgi:hypothetical protein
MEGHKLPAIPGPPPPPPPPPPPIGRLLLRPAASCSRRSPGSRRHGQLVRGAQSKTPVVAFISQGTSNSWAAQLDAVAQQDGKANAEARVLQRQGDGTSSSRSSRGPSRPARRDRARAADAAADSGPVERAMAMKIPVVLCNSKTETNNYTSLVNRPGHRNRSAGRVAREEDEVQGQPSYIGGSPATERRSCTTRDSRR